MAHHKLLTRKNKVQVLRFLLLAKRRIFHDLQRVGRQLLCRWRTLNFAQRCYVAATLIALALLTLEISSDFLQLVMFSLVLIGLVREFWPRFMLVWDSLPGRALVLFCYAVMANFALASASGLVNGVTGITADALPYSHNFAIILMLPSWFFVSTVLVLLCTQLLMPIYLILLVLLKPFGVHGLWHPPDYKYVITTAFVRYIWTLALLIKIVAVSAQSGVLEFSDSSEVGEVITQIAEQAEEVDITAPPEQQLINNDDGIEVVSDDEKISQFILEAKRNGDSFRLRQKKLLADFIFVYEADTYSRCEHPAASKVVEINDYEILTIIKDDTAPLKYAYNVIPCRSPAIGHSLVQP
ncbi:hypothetical protein [Alteromonas sp. C1M14]|uniref:hypothetical protein n=1 Tax=Alteromonas sp. C1M14 TaxID=2841567 RepID=UPI001C085CB9|nr:hypothetical protein [Alteromonas sp. C1M14]MBU2979271.1 hypothetical protein [Alteromonas sp. C1M14]